MAVVLVAIFLVGTLKGVKEPLCSKRDGVGSLLALDVGEHVDEVEPDLGGY